MANKQERSRILLRIERRQRSTFLIKPIIAMSVVLGLVVIGMLVYSAYNQWFRPLGLGH